MQANLETASIFSALASISARRCTASLEAMSDLIERVRELLPSVRDDLENLVRIQSVWADPGPPR